MDEAVKMISQVANQGHIEVQYCPGTLNVSEWPRISSERR
jgi:hypothetical protein